MKKKRIKQNKTVCITEDQVYESWSKSKVDYSKSFVWNVCHQILSEMKMLQMKSSTQDGILDEIDLSHTYIDPDVVADLLDKYLDVAVESINNTSNVYITDLSNPDLMSDSYDNLDRLITQLMFNNRKISKSKRREAQSSEITYRVHQILSKIEQIDELRPLPFDKLSTSKGIYDVRKKLYVDQDDYEKYDLTYQYPWFIMTDEILSTLSEKDRLSYITAKECFKRAFYNWSCDDEELKVLNPDRQYLLKQVMLKSVLGDGGKKLILLQGDGGNGKSSYTDCIEKLIGRDYAVLLNIHHISKENKLSKINSRTKVIIGKDASTNTHLKNESLSNFKSLIQGESILIDRKYKDAEYVTFKGPYIQATNTDIAFHENSDAIRDRLVKLTMSPVNFRDRDDKINFDELLSTHIGQSALATLLIEDVDDIDSYRVTEEMKQQVDNIVNEADTLTFFIEDISHEFVGIQFIPDTYLFERYKIWHSSNMSGTPMNSRNFKKAIVPHILKLGYIVRKDNQSYRLRKTFRADRFNISDCYQYLCKITQFSSKVLKNDTYYEKVIDYFTEEDVKKIQSLIIDQHIYEFDDQKDQLLFDIYDSTHQYVSALKLVEEKN